MDFIIKRKYAILLTKNSIKDNIYCEGIVIILKGKGKGDP